MSDDDQDLKDEIAFHLQADTERRIERGESPEVARERLVRDFRFALRTLTRDASFSLIAIVTLALGIGATVAVFAIVNSILLRPLPFPDPDSLVMVPQIQAMVFGLFGVFALLIASVGSTA